jgi:beta-galactosidase/beta-glucuronidase
LILFSSAIFLSAAEWQPAKAPLMTRWARDVSPANVHPEYPRPQLVRKDWLNLNGLWSYAITAKDAPQPTQWDGQILVPFPIESALSGVMKRVYETNRLWYRRTFALPKKWSGRRVLLHFGAVDWEAAVWVNGQRLGAHRGGYDAFSFDITDALKPGGEQELVVAVWDPTDAGTQPRGKQIRNPHSIWYTPSSGIWQTVWLEPVNDARIERLRIVPDVDAGEVTVEIHAAGLSATEADVTVTDGGRRVARGVAAVTLTVKQPAVTGRARIRLPAPKLWSPDSPHLYGLEITLRDGRKTVDRVESYFAMRKVALGKDENGFTRIFLNNKPLFQFGLLDQGFWPDGLYTAPTDEALRYDIEMTKKLGFNLARKHVKIEPERWYYWADKLGLLVWQDMPSGDRYIGPKDPDIQRSPESAAQFEAELHALVEGRFNHPCIVAWVPYNEGWGQWDTCRIVGRIKQWDPTRLVINASGWADRGCGDIHDIHIYPGPDAPPPEPQRAGVLGEFGGLGLPLKGHTWQDEKNWGYRSFTNAADLTRAYLELLEKLQPLIRSHGLSAAVYTQTTDVEIEVNGLMTYDRAVLKMDAETLAAAARKLHEPAPAK